MIQTFFFSINDYTLNSIHNSTIHNLSIPSRRLNPLPHLFPIPPAPCKRAIRII